MGLSVARIELQNQLIADGQGGYSSIYCDTDSCYSLTERTRRIGNDLGLWQYEGTLRDGVFHAPKFYGYYDDKKEKWIAKAKGIPDAAKHWGDIVEGRPVAMNRGVMTFRSATREAEKPEDFFKRRDTSRSLSINSEYYGDRYRRKDVTLPMTSERIAVLP
jgi:hypothetical protein